MTSSNVRIVAVADTHLHESESYEIPEGDIFIHAGDMCRFGHFTELRIAAKWITSLPHAFKIVISGNHDWPFVHANAEARELFKDVTYLQDSATEIAGLRVYGSPWQPRFFDWAFNLDRGKALADVWKKIPAKTDVLITHGPPQGYGDLTYSGDRAGCLDLLRRIQQVRPRLHLFGHIHDDGGAWKVGPSHCVNVTTSECRRAPTVIDIKPMTGQVELINVPPRRMR